MMKLSYELINAKGEKVGWGVYDADKIELELIDELAEYYEKCGIKVNIENYRNDKKES